MKIANWITSLFDQDGEGNNRGLVPPIIEQQAQENIAPVYAQKRRYPRFAVEDMNVRSKVVFSGKVQISNIGHGGACIISTMPLETGNNVLIKISQEKLGSPLLGTVKWKAQGCSTSVSDDVVPFLCKAGIQFHGVDPSILKEMKGYIKDCGKPDERRPAGPGTQNALRYIFPGHEEAILNYLVTCRVKKISLGGMLIETRNDLKIDRRYPMTLSLPNDAAPVKLIGRVASAIPLGRKESGFDIGIEFCDLAEHDKKRIKKFIVSLLWRHEA